MMLTNSQTSRMAMIGRALLGLTAMLIVAGDTFAQRPPDMVPPEFEGIGVEEKLDARLPLDLTFLNEAGEEVTLGSYFQSDKPVILTLNYYTCPMLCHLTLNGLVDGMNELEWQLGKDFQVVTVSINPKETPEDAAKFNAAYQKRYEREGVAEGWHFHVGTEENIRALAEAVGFLYRFDRKSGEYLHSSTIQFITPDGRISKYMNNVMFPPRDLRFALVEASEGSIGSPMDRLLLFTCYQWNPDANSYSPVAWKLMRSGAAFTVVALAAWLIVLGVRGSRHERGENRSKIVLDGMNS